MSNAIGTLAWARESGGVLNASDSRAFFVALLRAQLRLIPEEWMYRLGLRRAAASGLSADDLAPPDSAAAVAAADACRAVSPEYLFNHCARSYGWARILAAHIGAKPDPELLYAAAMLHDLGLTETHGGLEDRPACFAFVGANAAARTLEAQGWDASRVDRVCEAITLHLNIGVDITHGPEAHLLNLATALDTTGLRKWRLTAADQALVHENHPRMGQNRALSACWRAEATRFPDSRAGWLERRVRFSGRLRNAPFAE